MLLVGNGKVITRDSSLPYLEDGAVVLEDALFFNRAGLVCYASKNRPYITTIGGHAFYA